MLVQYLAHRKKQESEEKRAKQKIAREQFRAMLEVSFLCPVYPSPYKIFVQGKFYQLINKQTMTVQSDW